jgi:hypothetical protein
MCDIAERRNMFLHSAPYAITEYYSTVSVGPVQDFMDTPSILLVSGRLP